YGLSYTTFDFSDFKVKADGENIIAEVTVTNTGNMAGKEVVQLYYSAPQGKLGKPARELAAFKKTSLLAPGESEKVELQFTL
uniref:fibronectin type III-like domain-contianing protein n=1 Tax=Klebsiella pneumoniae TaxID=573 RepID=UPI0025A07BB3